MCDTGDIVDIGAGVATGGASYAYKKITGSDVPAAQLIKGILRGSPDLPPLPPLASPPPLPDLSDELVKRAAIAQRLRNMTGPGLGSSLMGLTMPAPPTVPGLI